MWNYANKLIYGTDHVSKPRAKLPLPPSFNEYNRDISELLNINFFDGLKIETSKTISNGNNQNFGIGFMTHAGLSQAQGQLLSEFNGGLQLQSQNDLTSGAVTGMVGGQIGDIGGYGQFMVNAPGQGPAIGVNLSQALHESVASCQIASNGNGKNATLSWSQALTKALCAGVSLDHSYTKGDSNLGGFIRYKKQNNIYTGSTGSQEGTRMYTAEWLKHFDALSFGSQIMFSEKLDTQIKVGTKLSYGDIAKLRISMDSERQLAFCLEETLNENCRLILNGVMIHPQNAYGFGLGMQFNF